MDSVNESYSVFHRFRRGEFACGGLILTSSQFLDLPQRPLETMLAMKVVKIDFK
jgi:hypothetical protein